MKATSDTNVVQIMTKWSMKNKLSKDSYMPVGIVTGIYSNIPLLSNIAY